jgi:hypothetical protein
VGFDLGAVWAAAVLAIILGVLLICIPQFVAEFSNRQPVRTGETNDGFMIIVPIHTIEGLFIPFVIFLQFAFKGVVVRIGRDLLGIVLWLWVTLCTG